MLTPGTSRDNSFDALRLIAASLVLVSHSFALTGRREPQIGPNTIGAIGVMIFFGISGFLITQSWQRQPRLVPFFVKRALRILPALAAVLVLCAFVIGPLVTSRPLGAYFGSTGPWSYVGHNLAMITRLYLPGVFTDNPAYAGIVNGPIWTLPHEVHAYVAVALFGAVGILRYRVVAVGAFGVLIVAANHFPNGVTGVGHPQFIAAFASGSLLYLWRDAIKWHASIAVVLAAGAVVTATQTRLGEEALSLAIPYVAIYLAYRLPRALHRLTRHGDFSYGLYLWAWPFQALCAMWWHTVTPWAMVAIVFPLALVAGATSWRLVERRALGAKRLLVRADSIEADAIPVPSSG